MHIKGKVIMMQIQVNLNGQKRKVLAEAVGAVLNTAPQYKGPPTYNYEVGRVVIGRDGTINFQPEKVQDAAVIQRMLEELAAAGFAPVVSEMPDEPQADVTVETVLDESPPETALNESPPLPEEPPNLIIKMPLEGFNATSLQNLRLLVQSKATLIKKALGIEALPIEVTETTVDFPWFQELLPQPELKAYTDLIVGMCNMAKRQQRILAAEKPTDNEKFTFRLFLVRLGLIGDEYADTRRILLRNLTGNGSWKNGEPPQKTAQLSAPAPITASSATPPTSAATHDEPSSDEEKVQKRRFSWRNWLNSLKMMGY
jgi:hypothetical protein